MVKLVYFKDKSEVRLFADADTILFQHILETPTGKTHLVFYSGTIASPDSTNRKSEISLFDGGTREIIKIKMNKVGDKRPVFFMHSFEAGTHSLQIRGNNTT